MITAGLICCYCCYSCVLVLAKLDFEYRAFSHTSSVHTFSLFFLQGLMFGLGQPQTAFLLLSTECLEFQVCSIMPNLVCVCFVLFYFNFWIVSWTGLKTLWENGIYLYIPRAKLSWSKICIHWTLKPLYKTAILNCKNWLVIYSEIFTK
jgi:hypothetical protein